MEHVHRDHISRVLQWSARLAAAFLFGVIVLFMTGETPPPLVSINIATGIEMAGVATILVGYALGWRHATLGGLVSLAGVAAVHGTELLVNGTWAGWAFSVMALPAIMYIAAGYTASRKTLAHR